MQNEKCKMQNAKVKMEEVNAEAKSGRGASSWAQRGFVSMWSIYARIGTNSAAWPRLNDAYLTDRVGRQGHSAALAARGL